MPVRRREAELESLPESPVPAARKKILVVEDDDDLRGMFQTALSISGFDVREARSGFEALRTIDSNPPDLILLDLRLPGIDGFAVHQEIAANAFTRNIPVVIVTASTDDLSHVDVACVLRKPVHPDKLLSTVRSCLLKGAPTQGANSFRAGNLEIRKRTQ